MHVATDFHPTGGASADDYQVLDILGSGGFGVVFRALAPATGQTVALKMLGCQHMLGPEGHRHFGREARLLDRVRHPGVVELVAHGCRQGNPFIVTGYVAGRTLEALIEDEAPLAPERAVDLAIGVLEALVAVHAAGVVHRDLKPSNIMVRADGTGRESVVLLDFGAAATIGDALECSEIVGTPHYMAPEQVLGGTDARVDVFAVGALLFEMLTGRKAFPTRTIRTLLARADLEQPPTFDPVFDVPPALQNVVRTALVGQRAWRHPSAQSMLSALRRSAGRAWVKPEASPGPSSDTGLQPPAADMSASADPLDDPPAAADHTPEPTRPRWSGWLHDVGRRLAACWPTPDAPAESVALDCTA